MIVVAGPIASGKTRVFRELSKEPSLDSFNVDDRCAELNDGSYQNLPREVVEQATQECREFIGEHIREGCSFVVETTLRSHIAIQQAIQARSAGFETEMYYVATDNVEINVKRAADRELGGGRDIAAATVRDIYSKSLSNIGRAIEEFGTVRLIDNSIRNNAPTEQLVVRRGRVRYVDDNLHHWVRDAVRGTPVERHLERDHGR